MTPRSCFVNVFDKVREVFNFSGACMTPNDKFSFVQTACDKDNGWIGLLFCHHIVKESWRQLRFGAEKVVWSDQNRKTQKSSRGMPYIYGQVPVSTCYAWRLIACGYGDSKYLN